MNMDQDELLETIAEKGLTSELEDEVAGQASDLIEQVGDLDDDVLEVVLENL